MTLIVHSGPWSPGWAAYVNANIAGRMAKYLATSFAIENVVRAPRVISSCLPTSTISISLVGLESRSTMLPASLAACVPVFMATPTSAWASAGASFVPSPVMATIRPLACSSLIRAILFSGVASARKSSTPDSLAMYGGGDRVVAGDHHRADAHLAQLVEALLDAALDDVLEVDDAERPVVAGDHERRAALAGDAVDGRVDLGRHLAAALLDEVAHGIGRALADDRAVHVHAAHAGRGRERHELGFDGRELVLAHAELLGQDDDRAALGRLVGQRRELGGLGQIVLTRRPGRG